MNARQNKSMELKLLVVRTSDPKRLADFYSLFDINFDYHRNGNSPFHYGGEIGNVLMEIYPLSKKQLRADTNLRTGFSVDDFDAVIERLKSANVIFDSEPKETELALWLLSLTQTTVKLNYIRNNYKYKPPVQASTLE